LPSGINLCLVGGPVADTCSVLVYGRESFKKNTDLKGVHNGSRRNLLDSAASIKACCDKGVSLLKMSSFCNTTRKGQSGNIVRDTNCASSVEHYKEYDIMMM